MTDEQSRPEDLSSDDRDRGEGTSSEGNTPAGDRGHGPESRPAGAPGKRNESAGYEVEPVGVNPPHPPAGRGGKLDAPGLLDDFDEATDFDAPPRQAPPTEQTEVGPPPGRPKAPLPKARVVPAREEQEEDTREPRPPLVEPGFGPPRVWAIFGVILLIAGAVAAGITSQKVVPSVLLAMYLVLFHTGTGVAALFVAAKLLARAFGAVEFAAARMFTAVASFILVFHLRVDLVGTTKWEELLLATGVYVLWIATLFRLWGRELAIVIGAHFGLVVLVHFGTLLAQWAQPAPAP